MTKASNFKAREISAVIAEIDSNYSNIEKQSTFNRIKTEFQEIISNKDYNGILRVFNLKKALIPESKVCSLTSLDNKESYLKLVITLLKKRDSLSSGIINSIISSIVK